MKTANHFNKSKRGQFGFDLADIFSYIGYFIVVLIIIIILNIPSCLTGIDTKKADSKLQEKADSMALVSADTQIASYLRTQMPERTELFAKLDWLEQHKNFLRTSVVDPETGITLPAEVKLDVGQAKAFLNSHPDVYADKDYSGFISSLQAVYAAEKKEQNNVKMAFKAVTTALFIRGFSNGKKLDKNNDGYTYYLSPVSVDFQNSNPGESGRDSDYDLSVEILPGEMLPERTPVQSIQVIPLADLTLAKIRLTYHPERSSWLPQP
ncbi:hypothetical protein HYU40_00595 [Candidatus Woesearchaeota archaeon]|nr:hypothetical protein [Candidatus Woesearchaeota archaeon]